MNIYKHLLPITLGVLSFLNTNCQTNIDSLNKVFASDMKKLIEINNNKGGVIDFSGQAAINLEYKANVNQIINVTTPYLDTNINNSKFLCYSLLSGALFKKAKTQKEKESLVEVLCRKRQHRNEVVLLFLMKRLSFILYNLKDIPLQKVRTAASHPDKN